MAIVLPDWCELVRGDGPVLLVAPHGGRRPPVDPTAPPANLKVNDVHTAELTRELAARLRATAIINHGCDRNVLDLNRISQVRRRAPWLFELLREEIEAILERHEQAEILFVHGWNVGQAKCDLGIGASETAAGLIEPDNGRLTVTRKYLEGRIVQLRAALGAREVATFLGVRYPASHGNNLLQAFTDRPVDEGQSVAERRLAEWAGAGRLQAIQLELGVPLRWPGLRRGHLVDCLVDQFGSSTRLPAPSRTAVTSLIQAGRQLVTAPNEPAGSVRRAASLQFYDPEADVGLLAGVGPIGKETTAARLLLFLGGQRVALFTGECTPPHHLSVEPLRFEVDDEGTTLTFAGPILRLDDGATYLDLEAAFAGSTLAELTLQVRFVRSAIDSTGAEFGCVEGWVDLGNERRKIATGAYVNAGIARAGQRQAYAMLAADFGDGHGVLANVADGIGTKAVEFRGAVARELNPDGSHELKRDPTAPPRPIELKVTDTTILRATPESRMEILRSVGNRYARVTFGTARFDWEGARGHGIYEYASLVG